VKDDVPWQSLLREALAVLALPPDEQVRVNGPGCVTCDLREDFDQARVLAVENAADELSDEQRGLLRTMDSVMQSMQEPDAWCFNLDALHRPAWQQLRELAVAALRAFGWAETAVEPFVEVESGVWRRPPGASHKVL
jgi:hypothetical protein